MAVTRLVDKVAAEVGAHLRSRVSEDDQVVYDVHLTTVPDEDGDPRPVLGVYTCLDCPETDALSTNYIFISVGKYLAENVAIEEVVNRVWEALVCFRLEHAAVEDQEGP